jgi:hypothetical protein
MAYFIDSRYTIAGVSLPNPELCFQTGSLRIGYGSTGISAIPARVDADEAGLLYWTGGVVQRLNGPTSWPSNSEKTSTLVLPEVDDAEDDLLYDDYYEEDGELMYFS